MDEKKVIIMCWYDKLDHELTRTKLPGNASAVEGRGSALEWHEGPKSILDQCPLEGCCLLHFRGARVSNLVLQGPSNKRRQTLTKEQTSGWWWFERCCRTQPICDEP